MKWVKIVDIIDPSAYLDQLPAMQGDLPPGAWSFASDPDHYNFYSPRCVKDLTIGSISLVDTGEISLMVHLQPNDWKHETGLELSYENVASMSIETADTAPLGTERLGSLILDEVLPVRQGARHELAFTGGNLLIVSADLVATWVKPQSP